MNGTKKIKYSRTDRIILGIAYVFLGVFVLSILIPLIYEFWHPLWIRPY